MGSVTTRLMFALGLVLFTVGATGVWNVLELRAIGQSLELVNGVYLPISSLSARLLSNREEALPLLTAARDLLEDATSDAAEERAALNATGRQLEEIEAALGDAEVFREEVQQLGALADGRIAIVSEKTQRAQSAAVRTALSGGAVVLLVAAVVVVLARRTLRPIEQLTDAVGQLTAGKPFPAWSVRGDDEVAALARAVNAMALAVADRDAERMRRQRAERLALVGQMLAQVTHEVRNPLNALSLNVELLMDDVRGTAGEPLAVEVMAEIRRLEAVTERYLDLARRPAVVRAVETPASLASSVVHAEEEALRRAGVSVTVQGAPPPAEMDGAVVRRALLNLIQNAAQAGATEVRVVLFADGERTVFQVVDNGPGVPSEAADHLFEPFFTTRAQGTGLGLAVSRQAVEDAGGQLCWVPTAAGAVFELRV